MTKWTARHSLKLLTGFCGALAAVLLAGLNVSADPTDAQKNVEEQSVRKLIADFTAAINRGDAKSFATFFREDADFVVITGKYLKGRNEIVSYHDGLFHGSFQNSQLVVTFVAVRFLRPDVAVARVATKRTKDEGTEMRTSFPMFVLTKQDKSWLIAAVQNTLTSGPPVTPLGGPN